MKERCPICKKLKRLDYGIPEAICESCFDELCVDAIMKRNIKGKRCPEGLDCQDEAVKR